MLNIENLINEFGFVPFQNRKQELTPMVFKPSDEFTFPDEQKQHLLFDVNSRVFYVSSDIDKTEITDEEPIKFDYAFTDDIGNLYLNDFKFNITVENYRKYQ